MSWEKKAFEKLAGLGAIVFLPTGKKDEFLLQEENGKLRPPGGHRDTKDKNLTETITREIGEEFAIPAKRVHAKLRFVGYEYRPEYAGNAVFEFKGHGLAPGEYQASNDPDEKIRLVKATLDDARYTGPRPDKLQDDTPETDSKKQARFFTYDELESAGKDAKLVTIYLFDPGSEDTRTTTTGLSDGETPEQAAVRAAKDLEGVTVDETAVEGMPKKDKNHWRVRVLLPASKEASADLAEQFKPTLTPDEMEEWGDVQARLYHKTKPRLASLASWPSNWTTSDDSKGWVEWMQQYHQGRRSPDDARQIKRWLSFKARNQGLFLKHPTPRRAWSMVNWGINPVALLPEPAQEAFRAEMEDYKERIDARAKSAAYEPIHRDIGDTEQSCYLPGMHNTIPEYAVEWVRSVEDKEASAYLEDMARRFQPVKSGFVGVIKLADEFGLADDWRKAASTNPSQISSSPVVPDLDAHGAPVTGPEAIQYALQNLDLDAKEQEALSVVRRKLKSKRPEATKVLGYIDGLRRMGYKPHELMLTRVPVIPAQFRPYSSVGDTFVPGDVNELYRDLINLNEVHRELEGKLGKGAAFNKLNVYDAVSALYGFGDPTSPKTRERGISGFLKQVVGVNPKFSYVQRRLLSKDQDYVARGVIGVDPDLGLDEIGVPESTLWTLYAPYLQRSLVRSGMTPEQALRAIRDKAEPASRALNLELRERPVIYSRAPSWHKFNVIAGYPKRIQGDMIRVNPLVTTGLNADFDGDTINVHLPSLPDTVDEAKQKLLPSRMLFSIKERAKVMPTPKQEFILGLYNAQRRPARKVMDFLDESSALKAIRAGQVSLSDEVTIKGRP